MIKSVIKIPLNYLLFSNLLDQSPSNHNHGNDKGTIGKNNEKSPWLYAYIKVSGLSSCHDINIGMNAQHINEQSGQLGDEGTKIIPCVIFIEI